MTLTLQLDQDVALVLFEALTSHGELAVRLGLGVPERHAFEALEAALERTLVEPFSSDYAQLVDHARESLLAKFGPE